ncbi:MAG: cysteine hydrolase [Chloroflexi bacterium]|nr:cysteine hydrolase [Chloroflexota bacterium]
MSTPLLIVDVQRGFLNEYTSHIPARLKRLIERREHDPVLFTRFVNSPDSPYHRILNWHECQEGSDTELAPGVFEHVDPAQIFIKQGHTGLPEELKSQLKEDGVERVAVAGIDTDMCVLKTAMDLFDLSIEPIVLVDCCASTAGLQAHLAGLAILSRNIGAQQLRLAGLDEGYLAGPPSRQAEIASRANGATFSTDTQAHTNVS